jgi:uncharacterized protein (DUF58 family)
MSLPASKVSAPQRFRISLRHWVMERVRRKRTPQVPPYRLEYRGIFILPTIFGFGFAGMLVFTALGGLNFNNNMALLLVFVLGALAQMTTLLAYRNLAGLDIVSVAAAPVFAGETARFELRLGNAAQRDRLAVQAAPADQSAGDCIDLQANSNAALAVPVPARQRGWLAAPSIRLETRYPLGMFRAWTWVFPAARCLVYPQPAAHPPPLPMQGAGQSGRAQPGPGDQVHALRNYRSGDSMRRIAWRSSARHDQLLTREMEDPRDTACVLNFEALMGLHTEQRLEVLTAWVLEAEEAQIDYRLELPGSPAQTARGAAQQARCLEQLALFGQ